MLVILPGNDVLFHTYAHYLWLYSSMDRNVKNEHLVEIFGHYGTVRKADLQIDSRVKLSKGFAYVEYSNPTDAENAQIHLDGGQLDGNVLKVSLVLVNQRKRRAESEEKGNIKEFF